MKINLNLLQRLAARFGVMPISLYPGLQKVLANPQIFIKAPPLLEHVLVGKGGYVWVKPINGYRFGQNQKAFVLPDQQVIWIFKDVLFRKLAPGRVEKWVSSDPEYPMGKANAFFTIYGKLTGQDLGQNEDAGDNVMSGEEEDNEGDVMDAGGPEFLRRF